MSTSNACLQDCPPSPNCVCTLASRESQRMQPINCQTSAQAAIERIAQLLQERQRVQIVSKTEDYLHATFRTKWLRFVDDVEFKVDREKNQLHFRSASRVGYSDLGANRKRMNELTQQLLEMDCFNKAE